MARNGKPIRRAVEKKHLKSAVVITVYNEEDNILLLLNSLKNQTYLPEEIVIVDGGSTDATYSILKEQSRLWKRLKVFQKIGNRSVGRNYGVSRTDSHIVVFTDAGCLPHKNWLENILLPFRDRRVNVVSGFYEGIGSNSFEKSLIPYVLVMPDKANKNEFLPATRSMALRREVWNNSGGFDVRLHHNEDFVYANWLKKMGIKFIFAPNAIVTWLPRKNLLQAAKMFLRFAIGDAQAGILRPKVKLILGRYLVFTYLFLLAFEWNYLIPFVALIMVAYLIWSVAKNYRYVREPGGFFWLPTMQITSDLMVIIGTIMGMLTKTNGLP